MYGLRIDRIQARTALFTRVLVFTVAAIAFVACVEQGPTQATSSSSEAFDGIDRVCNKDNFTQISEKDRIKKVDFLFVMDTSGSMQNDWERVANDVRLLVQEMPSDVDAHYAVLVGAVGKYSGRLFAGHLQPRVLSSKDMDQLKISQSLHRTFVDAMKVYDEGSGEALFYSLYQAVTRNAKENQDLGFFRADAALSVIFMSDEHEIGSAYPKLPGVPSRCDQDFEEGIRKTWYIDKGIDVETTYQAVKRLKGDMPFTAHAIVNRDADDLFRRNPNNGKCLYDSIGYGYMDMVQKCGGVLFSIEDNREDALQFIGQYTNQSMWLIHEFKLSWTADKIDSSTINAQVDSASVPYSYNTSTDVVHLENAGSLGSSIAISYCSPSATNQWSIIGFSGTPAVDQVALTWQTPAANTTGVVRYGLTQTDLVNEVLAPVSGTTQNVTVTGLNADTDYFFQVIAKDDIGREEASAVILAHTQAVVPAPTPTPTPDPAPVPTPTPDPTPTPTPTENFWTVQGFDGTTTASSATMIWQTPGVLTQGTLHYGLSPTDLTLGSVQTTTAGESQIVTVDGLAPNTIYYFEVDTVDANGKIVASGVISKTTKAQ